MKLNFLKVTFIMISTIFLSTKAWSSQVLVVDKTPSLQSAANVVKTEFKKFSTPELGAAGVRIFGILNDEQQNKITLYVAFSQGHGDTLVFKLPDTFKSYKVSEISKEGMLKIDVTMIISDDTNGKIKKINTNATISLSDLKDGYVTYYLE